MSWWGYNKRQSHTATVTIRIRKDGKWQTPAPSLIAGLSLQDVMQKMGEIDCAFELRYGFNRCFLCSSERLKKAFLSKGHRDVALFSEVTRSGEWAGVSLQQCRYPEYLRTIEDVYGSIVEDCCLEVIVGP